MLPNIKAQTHYTRFKFDFVVSDFALNYFRFITLLGELTSVAFLETYSNGNAESSLKDRLKANPAKTIPSPDMRLVTKVFSISPSKHQKFHY